MKFSQAPNMIIEEKTWWLKFTSQSHQLFFTSAIFFSLFIMFLSLFIFNGTISLNFSIIHGFGLIYALFTNAFLGFLITVIPKYNGHAEIKRNEYVLPWILFQISILITLFVNAELGKIFISSIMLYFSFIFSKIIKNSKAFEKKDSILINAIFILGAIFLFCESIFSMTFTYLTFFSYLLAMVFIVAFRMVPAFYFNVTGIKPWIKPKYIREMSVFLLFILGFSLEFNLILLSKIVSFICLIFFSYIVIKLDFYKKTPAIMSVLTYSFFWLPIGFLSLFLETYFELSSLKLSFHIFALGFITTLLIGFGSRVSLGHAVPAQPIHADKITIWLFFFTQVIVLSRMVLSFGFIFNMDYVLYISNISFSLWLILFLLWSFRYGKILLRY